MQINVKYNVGDKIERTLTNYGGMSYAGYTKKQTLRVKRIIITSGNCFNGWQPEFYYECQDMETGNFVTLEDDDIERIDKTPRSADAAKTLRNFATKNIESLDEYIQERTGDIINTKERIKALNGAADFLYGEDNISDKKLEKTLNILTDIKKDYKTFKDEMWFVTKGIKKAINAAMDEISEELDERNDEYKR